MELLCKNLNEKFLFVPLIKDEGSYFRGQEGRLNYFEVEDFVY